MTGKFTNEEKAAEAKREVGMRQHVYAKIQMGDPAKYAANQRKLAIMQEIEADYRKLAEKDRLI